MGRGGGEAIAAGDGGLTLEQADLCPAALLNFRGDPAMGPPYLHPDLTRHVQALPQREALPHGVPVPQE